MRIKIDHVTNSSSASFMIPKSALTEDQMKMIRDYHHTAIFLHKAYPNEEKYNFQYYDKGWVIEETQHSIQGHTSMDNFNMFQFLIAIGVSNVEIHYEHAG